ncbi:MAG: ABC transporter ATP-binding protein [Gammaproteobacteria bacterium]|nr:ABC transporter ATP-binding protein [Gammaproteobacteria bacterium]MDH3370320.1 ABC transporter ATP-binding protein [Gammaproteobacteria bacterium]MDH3407179.1 ABC transporter ATP-binding protein [Gammaproteobacteria bacterium]MDH3562891.1 ABC transporter ATP-binding protein [Gammaproteobacteria bacterium]MDH5487736.1 ABC transporter ATP-binding protein [Gammaproteobacteria bacterium]
MTEPVSHPDHILCAWGIARDFGGVHALRDVDLHVVRGTITGLIGPNGSGKTTMFQVISGMDQGATGTISFDDESILGWRPSQIYRRGLARTFQLSRVFPELTVLENLVVAGSRHDRSVEERAFGLLERVRLREYAKVRGKNLSYGQQKLVEFLRVLMSDPALILLDEPAAGVNPTLRQTLWDMVRHLNGLGTTFLVIEHNMEVIADLCSDVYVLSEGEMIAHGDFAAIRNNEQVLEAYFGKKRKSGTA